MKFTSTLAIVFLFAGALSTQTAKASHISDEARSQLNMLSNSSVIKELDSKAAKQVNAIYGAELITSMVDTSDATAYNWAFAEPSYRAYQFLFGEESTQNFPQDRNELRQYLLYKINLGLGISFLDKLVKFEPGDNDSQFLTKIQELSCDSHYNTFEGTMKQMMKDGKINGEYDYKLADQLNSAIEKDSESNNLFKEYYSTMAKLNSEICSGVTKILKDK